MRNPLCLPWARMARCLAVPLVVILALAGCSGTQVLNALASSDTYTLQADVPYGPEPRHRLDIYLPTRPAATPAPVVVFFYGGTWREGSRKDYLFVGEALASRGIMAVVADYQLYPAVTYPSFLHDSAKAVAWTARHIAGLGGDPNKLFVMGHSAGGYNAAMVALDPRWLGAEGLSPGILAGWLGLAGPYDFLPIENPDVMPVFSFPGTPTDSQPINHASAQAPRTFLRAGTGDTAVEPQRNTMQLARLLGEAGVKVDFRLYSGVGHVMMAGSLAWPLRAWAPVLDDVSAFVLAPP